MLGASESRVAGGPITFECLAAGVHEFKTHPDAWDVVAAEGGETGGCEVDGLFDVSGRDGEMAQCCDDVGREARGVGLLGKTEGLCEIALGESELARVEGGESARYSSSEMVAQIVASGLAPSCERVFCRATWLLRC